MRTTSLIPIAYLLLLTGCPAPAPVPPVPSNSDPAASAAQIEACETDCERMPEEKSRRNPNYHPLTLTTTEEESFQRALPAGKGAAAVPYLNASVVKGGLVFTPGAEPASDSSTTTTIAVPAHGSQPAMQYKIVASRDAAALLHQHLATPPR